MESVLLRRVRIWLVIMIVGLVVAGVTAFPLTHEVRWVDSFVDGHDFPGWFTAWLDRASRGIVETAAKYPFIAYGTDWLGYAHLMIAILFAGALRDPVRNVWVVRFGMIACASIIPLALIAGPVRGIPFWWTCIDMSFGIFGFVPLIFAYRGIRRLERQRGVAVVGEREDIGPAGELSAATETGNGA